VVLLARNEQDHIVEVVDNWLARLDKLGRDHEILLVDDGSSDRTGSLAAGLASRHAQVKVLSHPTERGVGAALQTALAAARHPLLFYAPCDRQFQPAELRRLLAEIDKVHLVSGYRAGQPVPGGLRRLGRVYRLLVRLLLGMALEPQPGWLGWRENAYRGVARLLFGVRLADVNCPFRLFRRSIFSRIPIQSQGPFVHVEILAKANFLGCYMTDEVPLAHRPRAEERPRKAIWGDASRVFFHPSFGPVSGEQASTD